MSGGGGRKEEGKKSQIKAYSSVTLDKFICELSGNLLAKKILILRDKLLDFFFHSCFTLKTKLIPVFLCSSLL